VQMAPPRKPKVGVSLSVCKDVAAVLTVQQTALRGRQNKFVSSRSFIIQSHEMCRP
jgi:hypothetical protein